MRREERLNNNIDFYYKRNVNTPRVALCLNFSLNQPEELPGVYAVMTRLLMQGTKTRSAEQIAEDFDRYAIDFSCELKQDYLRFKLVCLNEDFSKAVEFLEDIVKNSTFEDFEREVIKMQGEIIAELDSPRVRALENYYKTIFEGHSYGNTYTKILDNIDNLTQESARAAYDVILNNSRKVVTLVGDLDFDEVYACLNARFGDLPASNDLIRGVACPALDVARNAEIVSPELNQAHIVKGWLVPSYSSEEYPAFVLLNVILGASGLSSRLFLELRDKQGLAYVVRSVYEAYSLGANFAIYIATEPKNIETSLAGFDKEIEKIRTIRVSEKELSGAKNNIIGKWAFSQETNNQQAIWYAHYGVSGLGFDFNEKIRERIKAVAPEQILACAEKYFNQNSVISIVKP